MYTLRTHTTTSLFAQRTDRQVRYIIVLTIASGLESETNSLYIYRISPFCLLIAPASSTSSVSTIPLTTSINVTVSPPVEIDRNGIITNYSVSFHSPLTPERNESFNVTGSQEAMQNFQLSQLEEFQNYSIIISACTSVGCSGNTTNITTQTLPSGKSF